MRYREFDPNKFASVRKRLIREKGDQFQKTFLEAAREKKTFGDWVEEHLPVSDDGAPELPRCTEKITREEFREPPPDVERMVFDSWTGLMPREACRASFWGWVTASHIREDIIEPHDLALNGQPGVSGAGRIMDALESDDPKRIDDVVRTILRRFSGLPEARGGLRSVSVDCTFSRA